MLTFLTIAFIAGSFVGWNVRAGGIQWRFADAAGRGDIKHMQRLIMVGANPDARPYDGYFSGGRPITEAASRGQPRAVQFLIDQGVDINAIDATDTPLDCVMHRKRQTDEALEILKSNGAKSYMEIISSRTK